MASHPPTNPYSLGHHHQFPSHHLTPHPRSQGSQAADSREGRRDLMTDTPNKVCSPGQELAFPGPTPNHQVQLQVAFSFPTPQPRRGDPGGSRPIWGLLETNRSRRRQQPNTLILPQYLRAQCCRPQPSPPTPGLSSGQESSERRCRSRGLATDPCGRRFAPFHREAGQIQSTECGQSQGPRPSRCPPFA